MPERRRLSSRSCTDEAGRAAERAAWLKRLVGWNTLRYVVCDAGTVLQSALSRLPRDARIAYGVPGIL